MTPRGAEIFLAFKSESLDGGCPEVPTRRRPVNGDDAVVRRSCQMVHGPAWHQPLIPDAILEAQSVWKIVIDLRI